MGPFSISHLRSSTIPSPSLLTHHLPPRLQLTMDDNELQNGVQQVKTEQEKLSQSIQSFEYGASTAADLAKTTPWDDANDLLDHLQTVLKVVTSVEESAQDLDSTSQTQASAIDRLCKEARKRRDAARQTLLENQATTRRLQEEGVSSAIMAQRHKASMLICTECSKHWSTSYPNGPGNTPGIPASIKGRPTSTSG